MGRRYTMPCKHCGNVGGTRFKLKAKGLTVHGLCGKCAELTAKYTAMATDTPVTMTITHEQMMHANGYPFVRRVKP